MTKSTQATYPRSRDESKRIGLLMHSWTGHVQGVQLGIAQYFLQKPDWSWERMPPTASVLPRLPRDVLDGLIVYSEPEFLPVLLDLGIPIVDLSNWTPRSTLPRVLPDDRATGRLAAEYLSDLGLRHFAYYGHHDVCFSIDRREGFVSALREQGFTVNEFPPKPDRDDIGPGLPRRVLAWVEQLPKPSGLFAAHDNMAEQILVACRQLAIPVPEHLCVLGVDNDELASKFSHPPLSSIALPTEKIGYEAARLLDRLMAGEPPPAHDLTFAPVGVVARQSTNWLLIPDEDVLMAVRYIREHVHKQVTVQDLLAAIPVNRRYLERKFKEHIGRTPLQEINRVRIEKAKELLAATDLSMPVIARQSGFPNAERLANVFHQKVGISPSKYRRKFRLQDP